ncbi:MAG: 2-C-methyl-D-erythritol 4-phosphate cytidylyltransferase [Opitutaceae bacterium]|nr:2-C-methyl-D-erythritol 4-phosphate cytidylyltransferase [Opitutaceae bacterium]
MTAPRRSPAAAILLAAGRGSRMRGAVDDKVLTPLAGQPVFAWTLAAFVAAGVVERFVTVYRDEAQRRALARVFRSSAARAYPVTWVRGGVERQHSVHHALEALPPEVGQVYIHDCARPLVHPESLRALATALARDAAACLAHRVTDTIKQLPAGATDAVNRRLRTVDRSRLWAMETPQAFARPLIAEAYLAVHRRNLAMTDDASALELATRHGVTLVENPYPNPKLTTPADLAWAEFLLRERSAVSDQRSDARRAKRPTGP